VFANGYKHEFSTEIFLVVKVISRVQPVYKLSDIQSHRIEGQFHNCELVKVTVLHESEFEKDEIVRIRNKTILNNNLSSEKFTTRPLAVG
jgi:hypothetical protein